MRSASLYAVLTTSVMLVVAASTADQSDTAVRQIAAVTHSSVTNAAPGTPSGTTPVQETGKSASAQVTAASLPEPPTPQFGVPQEILGGMKRTDFDFADGLAIDLFSPTPRTLTVTQNRSPSAPANLVTGAPGGPWLAALPYSYVLKLNESNVNDLVAKVELPYDPAVLAGMGLTEDNTYVGTYSPTTGGWVIDQTQRNVHRTENKTRIINMNSYDGEYLLLARNTTDTADIFLQYGQGASRELEIIRGGALQEGVWVDGFTLSARVDGNLAVKVNADFGTFDQAALPAGFQAVTTYTYVTNSSDPTGKTSLDVKLPFKPDFLATRKIDPVDLRVARMDTGSKTFVVDEASQKLDVERKFAVLERQNSLDGQWLLVFKAHGDVNVTPTGTPRDAGIEVVKATGSGGEAVISVSSPPLSGRSAATTIGAIGAVVAWFM
ncbi:uncharacterized protein EV422DRAFT_282746 [Fimicolochytrium jonesii]|uniref:uncharacterized protein n=1 Tax=Fimicolochytrium jonesii TaxID=1396493 RepID=UPI0022FDB186|nr:uncharacterized protein EV422DRAFT_282746 [Fimicolochytrium jonesii]KAI8816661.1 hypothetical protein EV422DRAFT_282746 [Fimicolochytrium jonesii]